MVTRVRRHLFDAAPSVAEFSDATILEAINEAIVLEPAALAQDERGRLALAKVSEAASLVANTEDYAVPSDCVRLLDVRIRSTSTAEWESLTFSQSLNTPRHGQALWFNSGAAILAGSEITGMVPFRWCQADDPTYVRIVPKPTVAGPQICFWYVAAPQLDYGDPDDPDDDPTMGGREGYDALVCLWRQCCWRWTNRKASAWRNGWHPFAPCAWLDFLAVPTVG
jgi:hypothetical protein